MKGFVSFDAYIKMKMSLEVTIRNVWGQSTDGEIGGASVCKQTINQMNATDWMNSDGA